MNNSTKAYAAATRAETELFVALLSLDIPKEKFDDVLKKVTNYGNLMRSYGKALREDYPLAA